MESRFVQAITAHPAADGIAEQLLHKDIVIPFDCCTIHTVTSRARKETDFSLLEYGDFVHGYIGMKFVLKTVDLDELTVKLFFVGVELMEEGLPFVFVLVHAPFQSFWVGWLTVSWLHIEAWAALEVPGGLVGVPVLLTDGYVFIYFRNNRIPIINLLERYSQNMTRHKFDCGRYY